MMTMMMIVNVMIKDNDEAKYMKYDYGANPEHCVYKELEAAFQANVDTNFPQKHFHPIDRTINMFDVCVLPQLLKYLKASRGLKRKAIVVRFTYTDTRNRRILNIEQLSMIGVPLFPKFIVILNECTDGPVQPFPRNVRRMVNNRNSLETYWQKSSEFIEEWKLRYLLTTKQQQVTYCCVGLCICNA